MPNKDSSIACLPPHLATDFIDTMPICFSFWDENLNAVYCNQAYMELFKLKNIDEYRIYHQKFTPKFQPNGQSSAELGHAYIQTTLSEGRCKFDWTFIDRQGEPIISEVTLVRVIHDEKKYIACYLRDMREVFASEKKAKTSKQHMQFLLDTMPLATQTWSKDLKLIDCSFEMVRMLDLNSKQEFIEKFETLHPEYQPNGKKSSDEITENFQLALKSGYTRLEWTLLNAKGELVPADVTLIRSEQDDETVFLVYVLDLRAHYESLAKLRTAEEHTKILLDASPFGTLIWDKDFNLMGGNKAIALMFGLNETHEFIENFHGLIPEYQPDGEQSFDKMFKTLQECYNTGSAQTYWVGQDLNGTPIPTEVVLVRVSHNNEYMIAGYIKDLREIEDSRKQLKAAEAFTQAILDGVPLAISITDNSFKRLDCNAAMVELFGLSTKEEFIKYGDLRMPETQPDGRNSYELSRKKFIEVWSKGKSTFEVYGQHLNGELIPLEVTLIRSKVEGQDILISYMKDLREIKAGIKKIQDAEERVQTILNSAPFCINLFDKNGQLLDCNQEGWELFGFSCKQDFFDNFQAKLFPPFQPDGRPSGEMVQDALIQATQKGEFHIQTMAQTLAGEPVPCNVILKSAVIADEDVVISYVLDLREINAALEKAHTATKAAEKSAQAKSDFLANMSHEIRTPMNGILGLLHILSQSKLSEGQKDYLEKATFSANNLLRIIDDILDFSKIEAGKLEIENTPFSLHDICSEIQSLFMPKMNDKNLACNMLEGPYATKTLMGDPLRLKQVLLNLVGNAIKFTNKGHVTLCIEAEEHHDKELHCTFRISDSGIGLSQEHIDNLFEAFSQADTSVTRKYGGTGLGLIISKRLVEMMQGKIWVESTLGQGSTFSFTAVFKYPDAKELQALEAHAQNITNVEQLQGHARILLVEDNDINQIIAEELLTSVGYTVDIANNGQEALDMLDKKAYDIVLMDIQMPVMDGLTAATKIRAQEKYADLPVIAMSAHAMKGDKEISLQHGLNDHITKPISPQILYKTLDHWLSKRA